MSNQLDPLKVITGRVRLSYVNLFTPRASEPGQDPKYSTTILIPKSDFATKHRIDAAINAAIQMGISEKFGGQRPPMLNLPIHDGDGVRPSDGTPYGEECRGHWVLTSSTKQKPEVVDIALNPITNQTEVYSGMYGRVSMRFFPYNSKGKKGIGCGLNNVQKLEDGEPLGGRSSATSDFGDPQQPGYTAPSNGAYYPPTGAPVQQPGYGQPAAPQQPQQAVDPITGLPINGGIYGL